MKVNSALNRLIAEVDPKASRRGVLLTSVLAGVGGALGLAGLTAEQGSAQMMMSKDKDKDVAILNAAIDLEQQAIWAYTTAAGKLSSTDVGKIVLGVATKNLKDHEKHRDVLASAVKSMGGTPSPAKAQYDLSSYLNAKEGGLDSDANIAKLALALEYDAALAYNAAFSQLGDKKLVAAASTIGPNEVAHATAIRAVFNKLDASILVVPSAFISPDNRQDWVLKV